MVEDRKKQGILKEQVTTHLTELNVLISISLAESCIPMGMNMDEITNYAWCLMDIVTSKKADFKSLKESHERIEKEK